MNALAHCVEALYADGANPDHDAHGAGGDPVLVDAPARAWSRAPDDVDARTDVLAGAYLAGAAFAAAGSGIHHKICHVLGGAYDLPHAEMHTVVLPALHSPSCAAVNPRRSPGSAARSATTTSPGRVFDLAVRIGAPTDLASIGMPADRLDEAAGLMTEAARAQPRTSAEPTMRHCWRMPMTGGGRLFRRPRDRPRPVTA